MYDFKFWQEVGWAVVTAVAIAVAQIASETDFTAIQDWNTWLLMGVGAMVRAAGAAVLIAFGRARMTTSR